MSNTFGSLFAGVGGFDLGMESAGWNCEWQVEWDKHCQSVLRKHWPTVPKYFDIRDVDGSKLTPVDCIVFGSPCQDLSVAGKGGGLEGSRSGLFHEAIRVIKEMRDATRNEFPKWTIWENVPGALSSNKGNDFAKVIDEMANIGALAIEWHILDAQWFGLAQRRKRIFLLACYDPGTVARCPEQILPVPKDSKGHFKQSGKKGKQIARKTEAGSSQSSLESERGVTVFQPGTMVRQGAGVSQDIVPTLRAEHHNGDNFPHIAYKNPIIVDGTRVDDIRIYEDQIVPTLKHRMGTGGGQVPLVGLEQSIAAIPIQGTIIGRSDTSGPQGKGFGDENDPSYTLDTISQHGVMTPELVLRKLTPLECERLMGFPDNHTKYDDEGKIIADTNRYKMCGNAVASPVAKWIGEIIKNV
jgi:DNA (cytosine-5)-methyltransferase 1